MTTDKLALLKEILSLPTYFGREEIVRNYLIDYAHINNIKVDVDDIGNVYFTKGVLNESDNYPLVCAHIDSVYKHHISLINENKRKIVKHVNKKLIGFHPDNGKRTGLGGDDLAGVFICLQLIEHFDIIKCAFFVQEEYGCIGSQNCDRVFFNDVGFAVQFDAPGNKWYTETLLGIKIFNDGFDDVVKPVLEKYNVNNYSHDPYTDVLSIRDNFDICCANLPTGYYDYHTDQDYVKIEDVDKSIKLGIDFIDSLGRKKYSI
jgi:di/tripeptidase